MKVSDATIWFYTSQNIHKFIAKEEVKEKKKQSFCQSSKQKTYKNICIHKCIN